jgi:hypothetical protein
MVGFYDLPQPQGFFVTSMAAENLTSFFGGIHVP